MSRSGNWAVIGCVTIDLRLIPTGKPEKTQLGRVCRSGHTGTSPEPDMSFAKTPAD